MARMGKRINGIAVEYSPVSQSMLVTFANDESADAYRNRPVLRALSDHRDVRMYLRNTLGFSGEQIAEIMGD